VAGVSAVRLVAFEVCILGIRLEETRNVVVIVIVVITILIIIIIIIICCCWEDIIPLRLLRG